MVTQVNDEIGYRTENARAGCKPEWQRSVYVEFSFPVDYYSPLLIWSDWCNSVGGGDVESRCFATDW